jgi:hypothetical protein
MSDEREKKSETTIANSKPVFRMPWNIRPIVLALSTAVSCSAFAVADITIKVEGADLVAITTTPKVVRISINDSAVVDATGLLAAKPVTQRDGNKLIHTISIGADESAAVAYENAGKTVKIKVAGAVAKEVVGATEDAADDKNKEFKINFAVPASPAFDLLGLNPSAVLSPGSIRDFAVALADGRDRDGRLKSGIAIDVAPRQWFLKSANDGKLPDIAEENGFDKNFSRIRLSFATAQGRETADESLKFATGLSWVFFDATNKEKKAAKLACKALEISAKEIKIKPPSAVTFRTLTDVAVQTYSQRLPDSANLLSITKECEKNIDKLSWSERKAAFGIGRSWFTETGKLSDRTPASNALWLSYSQNVHYFENIEKSLQFAGILRRARSETVIDPAPATGTTAKPITQDSNTAGIRLKFGQKNGTISIEHSQSRQQMAGRFRETVKRNAIGFDWHIYGDVWISAAGGSVSGRLYGENKPFVLTSIRYGGEPKGE